MESSLNFILNVHNRKISQKVCDIGLNVNSEISRLFYTGLMMGTIPESGSKSCPNRSTGAPRVGLWKLVTILTIFFLAIFCCCCRVLQEHFYGGWIKEVRSHAELRGTLVRSIYSCSINIFMNVVRAWYVSLNDKKWLKRNARTPTSYNCPPCMDTGTGRGVATLKGNKLKYYYTKTKKIRDLQHFLDLCGWGRSVKKLNT